MKQSFSQKNYTGKKPVKKNLKNFISQFEEEDLMDVFVESRLQKKVELFRKKTLERK
ncbi:MAG: hypothetical protein ACK4ND_15215 [Cytophagaceae bacterium]